MPWHLDPDLPAPAAEDQDLHVVVSAGCGERSADFLKEPEVNYADAVVIVKFEVDRPRGPQLGCLTPRRRATRPIHVEVDPTAWAAMKLDTIQRRSTVGEALGALIQAEVERQRQARGETGGETPSRRSDRRGQPGVGRRAKVFARIVVADETWADVKALAAEAGITVARAVGLLVDGHRG